MKAVVAEHDTDGETLHILMGLMGAGLAVWKDQCAASGYVDEEGCAVPVTEARRLRVGMLEGSDDRSERQIAQVRYLGQRMQIFV